MANSVGNFSPVTSHIQSLSDGAMPIQTPKESVVQDGHIPTKRDDLTKFAKVNKLCKNIKQFGKDIGDKAKNRLHRMLLSLSPKARAAKREQQHQEVLKILSDALGNADSEKNLKKFQLKPADNIMWSEIDHVGSVSRFCLLDDTDLVDSDKADDVTDREESISLVDCDGGKYPLDDDLKPTNDEFSLSDDLDGFSDNEDDSHVILDRQNALHLSNDEVGKLISSEEIGVQEAESNVAKGKFWESRIIHDTLVSAREKLSEIKNKIGDKTSAAYANVKNWVHTRTAAFLERRAAKRQEQANKAFEELETIHGLNTSDLKKYFPELAVKLKTQFSETEIENMCLEIENNNQEEQEKTGHADEYQSFVDSINPEKNNISARYDYLVKKYGKNFAKNTINLSNHNEDLDILDKYIAKTAIPNRIVALSLMPKQSVGPDNWRQLA
jgi:hypothetical protein